MKPPVCKRLRHVVPRDGNLDLQKEFQNYFSHIIKHIPAHDQINKDKTDDLTRQLSKPFILLRDFNNPDTIWGQK